jgi:trehalose-6-phosphatase
MRPFLSPAGATALAGLARDRTLLVLADGALAPPGAPLRPETRALLRAAALLYPCAVISARRRAEVVARVDRAPLVATLGRHGAEPGFGPVDAGLVREAEASPARAAALRADAVAHLCRRLGVPSAAYVGDGAVDEVAFAAAAVSVGIRVGEDGRSAAAYWVAERAQVDDLLRALVAARVEEDGRGVRWQGVVRAAGG